MESEHTVENKLRSEVVNTKKLGSLLQALGMLYLSVDLMQFHPSSEGWQPMEFLWPKSLVEGSQVAEVVWRRKCEVRAPSTPS